jgi:hypothetical protein
LPTSLPGSDLKIMPRWTTCLKSTLLLQQAYSGTHI